MKNIFSFSKYFLLKILIFLCIISLTYSQKTTTDFIKNSCKSTTYPSLCFSSLSSHAAAIQSSPFLLATTALHVALTATHTAMLSVSREAVSGSREAGAMHDCLDVMSDSIEELKKSIDEMGHVEGHFRNFGLVMSDVETWVSAALTDVDTCANGFAGKSMDGAVKTAVRGHVVKIAHLTSNALALVNSYASNHG